MKIVFFGNADFGLKTLIRILDSSSHQVIGVVTNSDKKIGRNKQKRSTPIKKIAIERKINLIEQDNLSDIDFTKKIKSLNADIFLVIAYKIMPKSLYSLPKYGSVNLHASLLPQYRGAAPIQRAIIDNLSKTGLSTFFINEFVDKGKIILQKEVEILSNDTFEDLWKRLAEKGGDVVLKTLELVELNKREVGKKNQNLKASYAPKIKKEELLIDWKEPAERIYNKIRAFSPYPCMYTYYNKKRVKIVFSDLKDQKITKGQIPGAILTEEGKLFVKCGDFFIQILSLAPESKKKMSASEFINGFIKKSNSKYANEFR